LEQENTMKDLIYRLRERARIRRQIPTRKSVEEGKPDRISDLLEEAADAIEGLTAARGTQGWVQQCLPLHTEVQNALYTADYKQSMGIKQ
jgi:hypothetical protein